MVQRGGGAGFTPETFQRRRVLSRRLGQQLDGNQTTELLVFGFIHDAHAAPAQATDDPVVAPHRAGR
jgi:hypothetical protein